MLRIITKTTNMFIINYIKIEQLMHSRGINAFFYLVEVKIFPVSIEQQMLN